MTIRVTLLPIAADLVKLYVGGGNRGLYGVWAFSLRDSVSDRTRLDPEVYIPRAY